MKRYALPVTCPQCGGPIEHAADGNSDGLRAVTVCHCPTCRRDWLITATIAPVGVFG